MKLFRNILIAAALMLSSFAPSYAAQDSCVIPVTGPATMAQVMALVNKCNVSMGSMWSGPTPPAGFTGAAPAVFQFWLDTSTSPTVLRIYDGTSWVSVGSLDTSSHAFSVATSQTISAQTGTSYTIADANRGQLLTQSNVSASAWGLPRAGLGGSFTSGWFTDIRNNGAGTLTITPSVSTIDGASSLVLKQGRGVRLVSDGTNYFTDSNVPNLDTGSGSLVLANAPTLVAPVLGVATATSINGLTISTTTGTFSLTNGKTLAVANSLSFAGTDGTTLTFQGTGTVVNRDSTDTLTNKTLTSPTLTTPNIGAATATSINGLTITSSTGTLTIANLKTMTANNTLTFTGTDGTSFAFPGTSDTVVGLAATQTLTNKTLTAPTINGGTHTAITGLGIRSTGAAFDLQIVSTEVFTANRALTIILNDAARSMNLGGNFTTAGPLSTSGAFGLTLTATALTNVTLPTTGTLSTLAGTETLTNKTLTSPTLTTPTLGAATATSINGLTITSSTGTLTITNLKTLAVSNTLTFTGTDGTSFAFPGSSDTVVTLAASQTLTNKTLTSPTLTTPSLGAATATSINGLTITSSTGTLTIANLKTHVVSNSLTFTGTDGTSFAFPGTSDTVVTLTATQTLTNKTLTSPTLTTPSLGAATATSINGLTITSSTGTLTIANLKTLTVSNTLTFTGTDGNSFAFPSGSDTVVTLTATQTLTNKSLTAPTLTGLANVQGALKYSTQSAPAQITSDQNDYNPSSVVCSTSITLLVNSDAARNVTGMAGGTAGCIMNLINNGSFTITMKEQSASSSAANRFNTGGDVPLAASQAVQFVYDGTASRWRLLGAAGGGGGGSGTVTSVLAGDGMSFTTITSSGTVTMDPSVRRNQIVTALWQSKTFSRALQMVNFAADGFKGVDGVNTTTGTNPFSCSSPSSNCTVNTTTGVVANTMTSGSIQSSLMTTNTAPSGTASANGGGLQSTAPWMAFSANTTGVSAYYDGGVSFGWFLKYAFNNGLSAKTIAAYSVVGNSVDAACTGTTDSAPRSWVLAGSNDDSSYTTLDTQTAQSQASNGATMGPYTIASPASYIYYRLTVNSNNGNSSHTCLAKLNLLSAGTQNNLTLQSAALTASATVSSIRPLVAYTGSLTLNTDLNVSVSCDNAAHFATGTLVSAGTVMDPLSGTSLNVAEAADTSCGANTGTSIVIKYTTANNKAASVYGHASYWH